jgi:hypothetical protein
MELALQWVGAILGVIGTLVAILALIETRRTSRKTQKLQAERLLDQAFDLMGGSVGSQNIVFGYRYVPASLELARRKIAEAARSAPRLAKGYFLSGPFVAH